MRKIINKTKVEQFKKEGSILIKGKFNKLWNEKVKKRIIGFKSKDNFTINEELVYNDQTIGTVIKKIEDYGLALVKIEKIINPEREKIKITTKNRDKNAIFIFPSFLSN